MNGPREGNRAAVNLIVAWHKGHGYEFGRVRTTQALSNRLRAFVAAADAKIAESDQKNYAVGDDIEDGEYMSFDIPAQPEADGDAAQHKGSAKAKNPAAFREAMVAVGGMETVGAMFLKARKTAFYAILIGTHSTDRVAYVRHLNPMMLVKPGNLLATLGDDTLNTLEDAVFLMDDKTDIIVRPERIDIFNKSFFDALFFDISGEGPELERIVRNTLAALSVSPETLQSLVARSRQKRRQRRKIIEIERTGHLDGATITDFKHALESLEDEYDVAHFIRRRHGREEIYADDAHLDDLLEILNEDIFDGLLTGRKLAASKKRER